MHIDIRLESLKVQYGKSSSILKQIFLEANISQARNKEEEDNQSYRKPQLISQERNPEYVPDDERKTFIFGES